MKIERGKTYRSKDGRTVHIVDAWYGGDSKEIEDVIFFGKTIDEDGKELTETYTYKGIWYAQMSQFSMLGAIKFQNEEFNLIEEITP